MRSREMQFARPENVCTLRVPCPIYCTHIETAAAVRPLKTARRESKISLKSFHPHVCAHMKALFCRTWFHLAQLCVLLLRNNRQNQKLYVPIHSQQHVFTRGESISAMIFAFSQLSSLLSLSRSLSATITIKLTVVCFTNLFLSLLAPDGRCGMRLWKIQIFLT